MAESAFDHGWNSIHDALSNLFPQGTSVLVKGYQTCPFIASTLFATGAFLLERGGVYHRIVPESDTSHRMGPGWSEPNFAVAAKEVEYCKTLGQLWYEQGVLIKQAGDVGDADAVQKAKGELAKIKLKVEEIWNDLIWCYEEPVVQRPTLGKVLKWWLPALRLLIVGDEASRFLGFDPLGPWESMLSRPMPEFNPRRVPVPGSEHHYIDVEPEKHFAPWINPHLVRVVPKSRTPSVGCTMRSLSHNLALVPSEGTVDMCWQRQHGTVPADHEVLNLLLIPFPYSVSASAFRVQGANRIKRDGQRPWGWFEVEQNWLKYRKPGNSVYEQDPSIGPRSIGTLFRSLLLSAELDVPQVHGVILPELALDWDCYAAIVQEIQRINCFRRHYQVDRHQSPIEFLVAGIASREDGARGNFVATTTFFETNGIENAVTYRRAKHHRWRMTGSQIEEYALGSALDADLIWWEANDLPRREIGLTVFRKNSVFSAMICEDLARSEPCHEPLRSVGPNLMFVLLMDGPQLPTRWSARYATCHADDPGTSVLTLTSLALMERTNSMGKHAPSRCIAIWKDDTGRTAELNCPANAHAVVITLSGQNAEESTLDGRPNRDAFSWRYRGHQPVRLPPEVARQPDIAWLMPRSRP